MSIMDKGHGDGGQSPTDFATIIHTTCGMTFDEEGNDKFKFKQARFDNVTLTDEAVETVTVELRDKSADE
jgi:molybdopterin-guanine dinucleotide biosynthesis protein